MKIKATEEAVALDIKRCYLPLEITGWFLLTTSTVSRRVISMTVTSSDGFIPPSGKHDPTCEFLCREPKSSCKHSCEACDVKKRKEGRP